MFRLQAYPMNRVALKLLLAHLTILSVPGAMAQWRRVQLPGLAEYVGEPGQR